MEPQVSKQCWEESCEEPATASKYVDGEWQAFCPWHISLRTRHIFIIVAGEHGSGTVRAKLTAVHTYECPYWRMGKKHGPCNCGAHEAWESFIASVNPSSASDVWAAVAKSRPVTTITT